MNGGLYLQALPEGHTAAAQHRSQLPEAPLAGLTPRPSPEQQAAAVLEVVSAEASLDTADSLRPTWPQP